ncbi:hypothetical protein HOH51_03565 [bacterium]|jgi:hypothetical protein|nr:hypothetical protein [bacterium]
MNILLSWDLFIVSIFIIILSYSLIIGLNRTLKTIIATYLGILCADGLTNILAQYVFSSDRVLQGLTLFNLSSNESDLIALKVFIFLAVIVALTVRGVFNVHLSTFHSRPVVLCLNIIFGFLNAGLIVATMLIYISGASLLTGNILESNIVELYTSSFYVRNMIDYYNFWFSVPVLIFIFWSLLSSKRTHAHQPAHHATHQTSHHGHTEHHL